MLTPPHQAEASSLLRTGPPARPATVLYSSRFMRLESSLSPSFRIAVSGHAIPRSARKPQARLAPPLRRAPPGQQSGQPPDLSQANLPDPHLTHHVRLFPHRSPRRSSANAAEGGLKPPPKGGSEGPAILRLSCSTALGYLTTGQPPAFVAHRVIQAAMAPPSPAIVAISHCPLAATKRRVL